MMRTIVRTNEEIDVVMNLSTETINSGSSKWPGMTYEDGVSAALAWLFGETEDNPMVE